MIDILPKWILNTPRPCFYDVESATTIEMVSRLHGKMNELIGDYNKFVDEVNKKITDFMNDTTADRVVFETAMRQEFQDFIDVVNVKYNAQEQRIEKAIADGIAEIESAVDSVLDATY